MFFYFYSCWTSGKFCLFCALDSVVVNLMVILCFKEIIWLLSYDTENWFLMSYNINNQFWEYKALQSPAGLCPQLFSPHTDKPRGECSQMLEIVEMFWVGGADSPFRPDGISLWDLVPSDTLRLFCPSGGSRSFHYYKCHSWYSVGFKSRSHGGCPADTPAQPCPVSDKCLGWSVWRRLLLW